MKPCCLVFTNVLCVLCLQIGVGLADVDYDGVALPTVEKMILAVS